MALAQEVEMRRRQLDELTAQNIKVRQQSSSTMMNAAVSGLAEAVRMVGQSLSKPRPEDRRVRKPEPYAPAEDFDDWDFTFNGYAGTLDLAYLALLKTAGQSPTVVMATPPDEQQSGTLLYLLTMRTQKGARKAVRKAGNNDFENHRQLCLLYGTSDHEGSAGLLLQIMTYKFCFKIEEFLELVRRYDEGERYRFLFPIKWRRANLMRSPPKFLEGAYVSAVRLAMEEVREGRRTNNDVRRIRGWKLFFMIPRMLVKPLKRSLMPKSKLRERFAQFAQGSWIALISASREVSEAVAVAKSGRSRNFADTVERRAEPCTCFSDNLRPGSHWRVKLSPPVIRELWGP